MAKKKQSNNNKNDTNSMKRISFDTINVNPLKDLHFDTIDMNPFKDLHFDTIDMNPFKDLYFDTIDMNPFKDLSFDTIETNPFKDLSFDTIDMNLFKDLSFDTININPIKDVSFDKYDIDISKDLSIDNVIEPKQWTSLNSTTNEVSVDSIDESTYRLIYNTFLNEDYEEGVFKESRLLYEGLREKYELDAIAKVYLNIFRNNISDNSNFHVVRTLLNHISDINEQNDIIWSIAQMAISLIDVVSVDLAVACFEKWGSKINIGTLKAINISEVWLKEYVDDVISYLESL